MMRTSFDPEFGLMFSREVWASIEQAIRIRLLIAGMNKDPDECEFESEVEILKNARALIQERLASRLS